MAGAVSHCSSQVLESTCIKSQTVPRTLRAAGSRSSLSAPRTLGIPIRTAGRGKIQLRQTPRPSLVVAARRTEYDDDDGGRGIMGLVPGILGGALGAVGTITDFVLSNLPASVSRGVVDLSVKAGLALVVLGFARSLLSLVLTVGTIVFGLFVASKVLGGGGNGKTGR